ncbi:unnamed protein product, partial [Prorocentrum cordatum]
PLHQEHPARRRVAGLPAGGRGAAPARRQRRELGGQQDGAPLLRAGAGRRPAGRRRRVRALEGPRQEGPAGHRASAPDAGVEADLRRRRQDPGGRGLPVPRQGRWRGEGHVVRGGAGRTPGAGRPGGRTAEARLSGARRVARHGGARQVRGAVHRRVQGLPHEVPAETWRAGRLVHGRLLGLTLPAAGRALPSPRCAVTSDGGTASIPPLAGGVPGLGAGFRRPPRLAPERRPPRTARGPWPRGLFSGAARGAPKAILGFCLVDAAGDSARRTCVI